MVVAGHPWEATQRVLRSAAQRARIAEDLKRSLAPHRLLLWLRSSRSYAMHRISPSPLVGEGWGEGAGAREIVATRALVVTLRGPRMTTAGGWRKARRVAAWMRPVFRQDTDVLSKNPVTRPRTCRAAGPEGASSACHFFWHCHHLGGYFSLLRHPALRPSGRLRRSHALLRVRGQAKKSDPDRGSGSEARRRRARSRSFYNSAINQLHIPMPMPKPQNIKPRASRKDVQTCATARSPTPAVKANSCRSATPPPRHKPASEPPQALAPNPDTQAIAT